MKNATEPTAAIGADAWMDPDTRDVINAERKQSWLDDYGTGGRAKAATYTVPLVRAALDSAARPAAVGTIGHVGDGPTTLAAAVAPLLAAAAAPIDMVLYCPACGMQHIDAPEGDAEWTNPPHRSHLCGGCGHVWRPADVPTNGVAAVKTAGKTDSPVAAARPAAPAAQGDALDAAFEAVRQRLCELQRYSFVPNDNGVVRRVQDRVGNWIEFDDAHALFDPVAVDAARAAKEGGEHD